MLRDNMKQKLGSRVRGAQAAKSAQPGIHFVAPLLQRQNVPPDVGYGLNTRLLGLLNTGQMRGVLSLLEEHRDDYTSTPGLNITFPGQLSMLR